MQHLFTQLSSIAESAYRNTEDGQPEAPAGHHPAEESSIRSLLTRNAVSSQKPVSFHEGSAKVADTCPVPQSVHCGQSNSGRFWVDQLALASPPDR